MKTIPKDRIILPLDTDSLGQAVQLVSDLKEHVGLFKIGLTLFSAHGPKAVGSIKQIVGPRLFLDLKFHDIPETVSRATRAVIDACGPFKFLSVHISGGEEGLRAAVEAAKGEVGILGVTVLTSQSESGKDFPRVKDTMLERVLKLSKMAKNAGCAGVVCSAHEAAAVRSELGHEMILVIPGIRPNWSHVPRDDQQRIQTPTEAIKNGADYIVVGRPIYQTTNPIEAASRISREIQDCLGRVDPD